ncbi:MAG: protein sorting system archaetidylserine synthase [Haloarculaceae archaeon]
MSFRLAERLGRADLVTLANAVLGVAAVAVALVGRLDLVARLLLLAAIADGLDGIVARRYGGSAVGPTLDAMADVVSFGAAPAVFVLAVARAGLPPVASDPTGYVLATAVAALVVSFSLVRAAMYTVHFPGETRRPGIQNTLLASILAAAYLAGLTEPIPVIILAAVLSVLQVAPVSYPKLRTRDAFAMGAVQFGAVVAPTLASRLFPRALLLAAVAYSILAPKLYWGE